MAWICSCLGFITGPTSSAWDSFLESNTGRALAWVWDLTAGGIFSIILLSSTAEKLRHEVRRLTDSKTEVEKEVEIGKLENKRLTPSAKTWLEEVGKLEDDAREFENSFELIEGFSLSSRYELGGKVDKILKEVRELRDQKENLVILGEAMPDPVQPQAIPHHKIVDIDENFSKIRHMLDDDNFLIIGIYGMGGVGKTTLLKEINNKLHQTKSDQFDPVIFVTVSNNVNIWEIQKVIGNRLGYSDDCGRPLPRDENERKDRLLASLLQKKFLLLLDDIWDKLELDEIGIPLSHLSKKGSKIVFTTRSHYVCTNMDAGQNVVEVCPLSESSSWKLFCEKSGKISEKDWTISTKCLAEQVVKGCGGLPLALITVGSAMASVFRDVDWEGALMTFNRTARELPNMEDKVLIPLKFSYDRLKDERHKECLLYCALYPEDRYIKIRELIDYWVGEGFLEEEGDSIGIVRNRGRAAINALKNACLLEAENIDELRDHVKLHDMIRKMALWITSGMCKDEKHIFLSNPRENLTRVEETYIKRWSKATRISLSFNRIEEMPKIQDCHKLQTLFLRGNKSFKQINCGFFQFMPRLTVLDLSRTDLLGLPRDIGSLQELRFLDLSWNYQLQSLPMEVWGLKKLKILNLYRTDSLRIPKEAILLFSSLQSLQICMKGIKWRGKWNSHDNKHIEEVVFNDLDGLKQLEELKLYIEINSKEDWCDLCDSRNLLTKVTSLDLIYMDIDSLDFLKDIWGANQLISLTFRRCKQPKQLTFPANQATNIKSLNVLYSPIEKIDWKDGNSILREPPAGGTFKHLASIQFRELALQEITWTRKLPNLQVLNLHDCNKMVEMITIEEPDMTSICSIKKDSLFPALLILDLERMKNLKSICNQPLTFPRLEYIRIRECSMLKKLPFRLNSGENLHYIEGDKTWWNRLEWEDENIKLKFSTKFLHLQEG